MMFAVETSAQVFVLHGDHVEQGTDSQSFFPVSQLFQGSLVEMLLFRQPLLITAVQFDVIFVYCCSCVLFKNKHEVKSCIKSGSTFRITFVAGRLACSCTSPGGLSKAQDCKNKHNHFMLAFSENVHLDVFGLNLLHGNRLHPQSHVQVLVTVVMFK